MEVDETYVGGRTHGKSGRGAKKTIVFGMVERGGTVNAQVVKDTKTLTLLEKKCG